MCGRYTLTHAPDQIARVFDVRAADAARLVARFNIAPGQPVAAVTSGPTVGSRRLNHLVWGLIPPWQREPMPGRGLINARVETVAQKPSFKTSFLHRRCLLPASGYYEWKTEGGTRHPYFLKPDEPGPFALAGIWSDWQDLRNGGQIFSCAVLTQAAEGPPKAVHDRMPVILGSDVWDAWLDDHVGTEKEIQDLLSSRLHTQHPWTIHRVSREVNDPRHDTPSLLSPLPASP